MTVETPRYHEYEYRHPSAPYNPAYLVKGLAAFCSHLQPGNRILDVGCGNGFLSGYFLDRGCRVVGIDLSRQGIEIARRHHPDGRFEVLAADDKVLDFLDEEPFDFVVSMEVIEHLYSPRTFARGCFGALKPGGMFLCTTPYHGYLRNLALCIPNRFDSHFNPLWDGGHIKFWSFRTLSRLLLETGFDDIRFRGAGRLPFLWKSMIIAAKKNQPEVCADEPTFWVPQRGWAAPYRYGSPNKNSTPAFEIKRSLAP